MPPETMEYKVFHILAVDDDPATGYLLKRLMRDDARPHELYVVEDGLEALNFLNKRGSYKDSPRPNLVLLDVEMPRLNGLETLAVIKNDPELRSIPVIMLSNSARPDYVRRSYEAHANCYVLKPTDLERSAKLIEAVGSFWIDFALEPPSDPLWRSSLDSSGNVGQWTLHTGLAIAQSLNEARSQTMTMKIDDLSQGTSLTPASRGCEEHKRLLDAFGSAVQELLQLHEQQFRAIVEGDSECNRFDLLIHMANEEKQVAKYAYLRHVESHGCSKGDVADKIRA